MKKKQVLFRGIFNYSREVVIKYSMAPTWAKAKSNMIDQLAKDHGIARRHVALLFDGSKNNYRVEIDPEWKEKKHGEEMRNM